MDPVELRQRNAMATGSRLPTGQRVDGPAPVADLLQRVRAMPLPEEIVTDYQVTRLSLKGHPMQFLRPVFDRSGGREKVSVMRAAMARTKISVLITDEDARKPPAAAYFPGGKDDPELTMLRLDLSDAEIWHSEAGPVRFAYEVAKANLTKTVPDMGSKTEVKF